jgi:uncharacterized protein YgiM (DUF1202 family)
MVKANWDYGGTGNADRDLTFKAGEEIEVLEAEGDWWLGTNAQGKKGYFAGNYVQKVGNW